jgi:hypothetical protein
LGGSLSEEDVYKAKLNTAIRYFNNGRYSAIVSQSLIKYNSGNVAEASGILDKLPSKEKLMRELLVKLKGKSIVKTWNKVLKGKSTDKYTPLKALFSLGSHLCVELEQGNSEYLLLLEDIYSRISGLLVNL